VLSKIKCFADAQVNEKVGLLDSHTAQVRNTIFAFGDAIKPLKAVRPLDRAFEE
jgi:hypothetical protein